MRFVYFVYLNKNSSLDYLLEFAWIIEFLKREEEFTEFEFLSKNSRESNNAIWVNFFLLATIEIKACLMWMLSKIQFSMHTFQFVVFFSNAAFLTVREVEKKYQIFFPFYEK